MFSRLFNALRKRASNLPSQKTIISHHKSIDPPTTSKKNHRPSPPLPGVWNQSYSPTGGYSFIPYTDEEVKRVWARWALKNEDYYITEAEEYKKMAEEHSKVAKYYAEEARRYVEEEKEMVKQKEEGKRKEMVKQKEEGKREEKAEERN